MRKQAIALVMGVCLLLVCCGGNEIDVGKRFKMTTPNQSITDSEDWGSTEADFVNHLVAVLEPGEVVEVKETGWYAQKVVVVSETKNKGKSGYMINAALQGATPVN